MGGFHIAQTFLGAVGYLMKGTGCEDILVESGISLRGTANKIMTGKDYYAMLRARSLVNSAMFKIHWEAFEDWLVDEGVYLEFLSVLSDNVQDITTALTEQNAEDGIEACIAAKEPLGSASALLSVFDEQKRNSPTHHLWLMHMDMMNILRRYIQAESAGLWVQHIPEVEKMMPYLVSAGHYKYVSCVPHYLTAIRGLDSSAPDIARSFREGNFTVHQTAGKFNCVWSDMALEKNLLSRCQDTAIPWN
jgi:hypothetical protein